MGPCCMNCCGEVKRGSAGVCGVCLEIEDERLRLWGKAGGGEGYEPFIKKPWMTCLTWLGGILCKNKRTNKKHTSAFHLQRCDDAAAVQDSCC